MSHDEYPEEDPILMGDVSQSDDNQPAPRRRKTGGANSMLALLIPAVLGGVTVFGVYFLFLKDLLNKPNNEQPADTEQQASEAGNDSPTDRISHSGPKLESQAPRKPVVTVQNPEPDPEIPPNPVPPINSVEISNNPQAAENALKMAEKMHKLRPSAARKWYQKVVDEFEGTPAAREAAAWLKKQPAEP